MGTMIDYLREYGDYTFTEKPLNEVDSLVLSQFAYLKFDGFVPEGSGDWVTMEYLDTHPEKGRLFSDERYREPNTELFEAMMGSVRFRTLRMGNYVNLVEMERETQFSAITFLLEDQMAYVAYRGTDETIVGWKEDFNLAFSEPVPGQLRSVKYLEGAAAGFDGPFYVGGHSKGGNFAVYASMNCKEEIRGRISRIYSHDGPGFRPEIRGMGNYDEIAGRVVKIIPHASLVGMLLESHADGYIVVESKSFGLLQHNPYTWLVREDAFVRAKGVYKGRKFMDEALNKWILSLDDAQIHSFVDTLYEVVSASEAVTLMDFTADWKKSMTAVAAAARDVDEETVSAIRKIISSLFEIAREHAKEELQEKAAEGRKGKKRRQQAKQGEEAPVSGRERKGGRRGRKSGRK